MGRSLCSRLLADGFHVRAAVRDALDGQDMPYGAEIIPVGSIGSTTDWSRALSGIDAVVHLAARAHVIEESDPDPMNAFREVNALGTERLAEAAAQSGVQRLVFVSSIGVNGERSGENAFTENDTPAAHTPYAVSKREAEEALNKIEQETGMEVVILRPPMVYGPNAPGNFARLIELVRRDCPLPIGKIKNLRSFIYIGNLVDSIIACIEHPKAAGQTFLVSDGQDISTPELIRMIAGAMGKKAKLFPCSASLLKMIGKVTGKSYEIERLTGSLRIDIAKIRKELSWTPPFTLEQGLRMTAERFISNEKNI
ncbi:MAG TPA: hypothetical protein DHW81_01755 [Nitrospiraceae bacterium]|nr:hypothetical protein [Nitrospiraceae bacterium]